MLTSKVVTSNGPPIARSIPLESCREYKMTPPDYMNDLHAGQIFGGQGTQKWKSMFCPVFNLF